jgi:excisionase family DNA binding protein
MKLIKTKQVAVILGVKLAKVYQLIKNDNLPRIKILGVRTYFFNEESIIQWKVENALKLVDKNSAKDVSKMLGVSISKVYNLAKNGMPCETKSNGDRKRYYFYEAKIIEWLLSQEQNKPAPRQAEAQPAKAA